jgi:hypothetical protein
MINRAIKALKRVPGSEASMNPVVAGSAKAAVRDASETLLNIRTIKANISSTSKPLRGDNTRKHPHAVATPLPPLQRPK